MSPEQARSLSWRRRSSISGVDRQISSGAMPPWDYLLMHPDARLSYEEKAQLINGLQATLGSGG